ncbi:MAG: response regulator [Candidatus Thermoplasmatota archaeon]
MRQNISDKKLMIVDDDPDILITIRNIFEKEGYEVFTVDSGKDCIKEVESGFEGVILMDIMMPFMDGWDTIKKIVDEGFAKNVTILIVTAKGSSDHEKMRGLEPYIHDYISKPFDVQELISDVKEMTPI